MIEKYLADMESGNVHKWTQFEDVRSEIHTIIVPFQSIEEIWPKSFEHVHLLPTGPNAWPLTNCSPLLVDVREDDAINSYNDTSWAVSKTWRDASPYLNTMQQKPCIVTNHPSRFRKSYDEPWFCSSQTNVMCTPRVLLILLCGHTNHYK